MPTNPNCFSDRPDCEVMIAHTHDMADAQQGQAVVWNLEDVDPNLGHFVIAPRRSGKRSFLARLADSVRGRK